MVYIAAWDVHRAELFGTVHRRCRILEFDRFLASIMGQPPYEAAKRVFLVVDNGTVHRGDRFVERARKAWPQLIPVHLPIHASWLNQVEIYLSILTRKALIPDHAESPTVMRDAILGFQQYYQSIDWRFTRRDLQRVLARVESGYLAQAA